MLKGKEATAPPEENGFMEEQKFRENSYKDAPVVRHKIKGIERVLKSLEEEGALQKERNTRIQILSCR